MNWVISKRKGADRNEDWLRYFDVVRTLTCNLLCYCVDKYLINAQQHRGCVLTAAVVLLSWRDASSALPRMMSLHPSLL